MQINIDITPEQDNAEIMKKDVAEVVATSYEVPQNENIESFVGFEIETPAGSLLDVTVPVFYNEEYEYYTASTPLQSSNNTGTEYVSVVPESVNRYDYIELLRTLRGLAIDIHTLNQLEYTKTEFRDNSTHCSNCRYLSSLAVEDGNIERHRPFCLFKKQLVDIETKKVKDELATFKKGLWDMKNEGFIMSREDRGVRTSFKNTLKNLLGEVGEMDCPVSQYSYEKNGFQVQKKVYGGELPISDLEFSTWFGNFDIKPAVEKITPLYELKDKIDADIDVMRQYVEDNPEEVLNIAKENNIDNVGKAIEYYNSLKGREVKTRKPSEYLAKLARRAGLNVSLEPVQTPLDDLLEVETPKLINKIYNNLDCDLDLRQELITEMFLCRNQNPVRYMKHYDVDMNEYMQTAKEIKELAVEKEVEPKQLYSAIVEQNDLYKFQELAIKKFIG